MADVKVNSEVVKVMSMNRASRRRMARKLGYRIIPSIKNVNIRKLDEKEKADIEKNEGDTVQK